LDAVLLVHARGFRLITFQSGLRRAEVIGRGIGPVSRNGLLLGDGPRFVVLGSWSAVV
jgi:hypothetical protein